MSTAPQVVAVPLFRPAHRAQSRRAIRLAVDSEAELTLTPAPDTLTLALSGDLDLATAARLTESLTWLETTGRGLQLDLRSVSFADCSGIRPILDSVRHRIEERLPPVNLTDASHAVLRLLALLPDDADVRALTRARPS